MQKYNGDEKGCRFSKWTNMSACKRRSTWPIWLKLAIILFCLLKIRPFIFGHHIFLAFWFWPTVIPSILRIRFSDYFFDSWCPINNLLKWTLNWLVFFSKLIIFSKRRKFDFYFCTNPFFYFFYGCKPKKSWKSFQKT